MRTIPHRTVISLLATAERGKVEPMLVEGSLVYDARDAIVNAAVDLGYDYILFADSDMVFTVDDLKKLLAHNVGIVSGLYISRDGQNKNVIYKEVITRRRFPYRQPKLIVDDTSTGFVLIKTDVVKSMLKRYKSLFEPKWGVGEDIAFCIRAKKCGYTIYCDRDVKLGHIGEAVYKYSD